MHCVARRDDQRNLLQFETAVYTFEICVRRNQGDEVVMGRNVHAYISEAGFGSLNVTVQYSQDFGLAFADRGTVDVIALGAAGFFEFLACGTDMQITIEAPDAAGAVIDVELHLT